MDNSVLTVQLPAELTEQLDRLAERRQRDKSLLVTEAIAAFVAQEQAVIAGIEQGLEDAALGRVMSHDEAIDPGS